MLKFGEIVITNKLLLVGILCSIYFYSTDADYVKRKEWGARLPNSPPRNLTVDPPRYVVIHHSASDECSTKASCIDKVRSFQNHHMDHNFWDDIGYNFVIGGDGNVYEGRGWGIKGAHSPPYNAKSIGICLIGTFIKKEPGKAAVEATQKFIADGVMNGTIANNYTLLGHRQTKVTQCPGDELYKLIQQWPRWEDI